MKWLSSLIFIIFVHSKPADRQKTMSMSITMMQSNHFYVWLSMTSVLVNYLNSFRKEKCLDSMFIVKKNTVNRFHEIVQRRSSMTNSRSYLVTCLKFDMYSLQNNANVVKYRERNQFVFVVTAWYRYCIRPG